MIKYVPMFVYIISTSLSLLAINHEEIIIDPSLLEFISFIICFIFFNIVNFRRNKISYSILFQSPVDFIKINTITLFIWFGTFWGLKYIRPEVFVSIYMGVIPLSTMLIKYKSEKKYSSSSLSVLYLVFFILALIVYEYLKETTFSLLAFYGLSLSILSGFSSSLYIFYSKKLQSKFDLRPLDFLCVRFYFVIIFCFLMIYFGDYRYLKINFILDKWYDFFMVALTTSIIPLYSLQKSILCMNPLQVSSMITLTPVMVYLFQVISRLQFNIFIFALILMMSLLLILYYHRSFYACNK